MTRNRKRFVFSSQNSHALEPRHLLTTVNVASLTGFVPLPNHASLTIGHAVAPATHTPASVGVHAAFTTSTSTHAAVRHPQRHAATDHSTSTLASSVTANPSATKHAGAATSSHAGQVKDAATGLTFYRARSISHTTAEPALKSSSALAIVPKFTAQSAATAVSPNASSASSIIVDCSALEQADQAAIDAAQKSYSEALTQYKLDVLINQGQFTIYQNDRNLFNQNVISLKDDVRAYDAKYGDVVQITAEGSVGTSLPDFSLKFTTDLTKYFRRINQNAADTELAALTLREKDLEDTLKKLKGRLVPIEAENAALKAQKLALDAEKARIQKMVKGDQAQLQADGCPCNLTVGDLEDAPDTGITDFPSPLDPTDFN